MTNPSLIWKNLRIKSVVLGGIFIGLVIPTALVFIFSSIYTRKSLQNESNQDHNRITEILSISSSFPLWNFDKASLKKLSEAIMTDDRVVRVSVTDSQNRSFLDTVRESRRSGESLVKELPIMHDGMNIGKVHVEFSSAKYRSKIYWSSFIHLFQFGIQLTICFIILALLINIRIISRLKRIHFHARLLADRVLNQSFIWSGSDEIAELGQALETTRVSLKGLFDQLEAIVEERTQQFKKQQEKLVRAEKMAALGKVCAGIAHEINTPLTVIALTLEELQIMAEKGEVVESSIVKEMTESLTQTANRMATIISGILTFSSPNTVKTPPIKVNIKQIIKDTIALCERRYQKGNVKLICSQVDSVELKCRFVEIEQAILNLLNNSFDAVSELPESLQSRESPESPKSNEKWVRIDVYNRNEHVEISVTDSGNGIPEVFRDSIFNPFFTTKEIGSGIGLGLSIAKGIIDSHGGSLFEDVDSPNTRFVIQLPLTK